MPAKDTDYDFIFKILIIGDPGAGKSSLLHRFADDKYTDKYTLTVGVDFKLRNVTLDGKLVKLQLWDTAGQEMFRTITSTYYRGAHGVLIVYDVTRQETFNNLPYWLKELDRYANDTIIRILIGNKVDLVSERVIEFKTAKAFADKYSMRLIETSAKTAHNVDEAFAVMAAMIRDSVTSALDLEDFPLQQPISLHLPSENTSSWLCC